MKVLLSLIVVLVFSKTLFSFDFNSKLVDDSSDSTVINVFDSFYDSFESDEGIMNKKIITGTIMLYQSMNDPKIKNALLLKMLSDYTNSVSNPEQALKIIADLKIEYVKAYGKEHPLILLYQGESLINANKISEAYSHFKDFVEQYPESIVALFYLYKTESNGSLKLTYKSILQGTRPSHWLVKKIQ